MKQNVVSICSNWGKFLWEIIKTILKWRRFGLHNLQETFFGHQRLRANKLWLVQSPLEGEYLVYNWLANELCQNVDWSQVLYSKTSRKFSWSQLFEQSLICKLTLSPFSSQKSQQLCHFSGQGTKDIYHDMRWFVIWGDINNFPLMALPIK